MQAPAVDQHQLGAGAGGFSVQFHMMLPEFPLGILILP
jgi:hypothetical protein